MRIFIGTDINFTIYCPEIFQIVFLLVVKNSTEELFPVWCQTFVDEHFLIMWNRRRFWFGSYGREILASFGFKETSLFVELVLRFMSSKLYY